MSIGLVTGDERLATLDAFPYRLTVLDDDAVTCDMLVQPRLLREALRALRALVRLLGQVRHHVTLQGIAIGETLAAHFADVRPILTVHAYVHSQRFLSTEQLPTLQARDAHVSRMISLVVIEQLQLFTESYLANLAVQGLRTLVELHVEAQPFFEGECRVARGTLVWSCRALHAGLALVTVQSLLGMIKIHACPAFHIFLTVS